jgi:hypothetical protein
LTGSVFLTPDMHIFNRICHYCIPLLEIPLRIAVSSLKHVGGPSKWQMNVYVDCAIVGLNAVNSDYCTEYGKH